MSEWYDSQKKPNSDIHKLVQERLEKFHPRREEITKEEATRFKKLEAIAEKLKRGENVQNRQLQTWLSEDEYAQIEEGWEHQLELREELRDKPSELSRYEDKLKQATFNYNRAEGYSRKSKSCTAKKFYSKIERYCEEAIEVLHEILHTKPYLRVWFDRETDFELGSNVGADVVSLPRLITSRSHERLREDSRMRSKLDVKLSVVEWAIYSIGR
jgi:hypothetical protein